MRALLVLFFISGFPALIYQIIWQRALFVVFGSNIEAVTLVVSAFMLGLGLGSLAGGKISSYARVQPLLVFGIFELAIGLFGIVSLDVIGFVGQITVGTGSTGTFFATFLTVLLPTLLMGATLPMLLMHLIRQNGAVGQSVSILYSVNTWGSAIACFAGAYLIFGALGMQGSVYLAASLNVSIGILATIAALNIRTDATGPATSNETEKVEFEQTAPASTPEIGMPAALLLVGFSGFIALSYEILWTRAFYLEFRGGAVAFPIVLGLFLAGIALGASLVKSKIGSFRRLVSKGHFLPFAGLFLGANLLSYAVIPALIEFGPASRGIAALVLVMSAAAFGAVLPLLSGVAVSANRKSGLRVSQLYVANIVGSTAGTIITGLVLLDYLSLQTVSGTLLLMGLVVSCALMFLQPKMKLGFAGSALAASIVLPVVLVGGPALHEDLYETLQFRDELTEGFRFEHVSETRSGVVAITPDKVVYGTGVYDGMAKINLVNDENGLFRATAVAAVHPAPRNILIIGLSSGAWTQILANLDGVETVTAVEINPGYLNLIEQYPDLKSILNNPKIDIVVDDGRRWLKRNPEKKFDVIVANTTFYWRAGASNLLSVEFLELVKSHLKADGVYYFNTTKSNAVQKTGASVFAHAARFQHFMFASESPIVFDKKRWLQALSAWTVDNRFLLDFNRPGEKERAHEIVSFADRVGKLNEDDELEFAVEFRDDVLDRTANHTVITDNNMGGEWPTPLEAFYGS